MNIEEIDFEWLNEYAEQEKDYKWGKQIKMLLTAYEKEKEKNKELEDTLRCTQNSWYEDTKVIIDKDKIIEELKDMNKRQKYRIELVSEDKKEDSIDESTMLKQIKSKLDEKNIPVETLLAEFERLEDLEDDLTTVYLNGVYDEEKKAQDKIKAKIEEIDEVLKGQLIEKIRVYFEAQKEVLQSLLEKE